MHILFLTHYFPPESNVPATRVSEMTRRWVRAGHEVTVITGVPNVPDGVVYDGYRNRFRTQEENYEGVRVLRVWTWIAANKGFFRRSVNYYSFMRSAARAAGRLSGIDVVAATSPQLFCGLAGSVAAKYLNCPFVLDLRDIWPESVVAVGAAGARPLIAWLEKKEKQLYESADHIVTVGEGYKQKLLEKNVSDEKISIVPNGVDMDFYSPEPADGVLARALGVEGKFVCSYVGTIGMASGLEVVLRAASLLKKRRGDDIAFLLVGSGALKMELEKKAAAAGLDNVVFAGLQDRKNVRAMIALSGACLVHLIDKPLFRTVLPSKIFEASAMARPIVHGVSGCSAEMISKAGAGLCFSPENEEELADAVTKLADDPVLCESMGKAAEKNIAALHDFNVLADRYLAVLERFSA